MIARTRLASVVLLSAVACGAPRGRDADGATVDLKAGAGRERAVAAILAVPSASAEVADASAEPANACGLGGEADGGITMRLDHGRAAIDGYEARVKSGNQTALGAAIKPAAVYLNAMHRRIHPIFSDRFVPAFPLDAGARLVTRVEIVLSRNGDVRSLGVVKTSGVTAYDVGVLESIACAAPFGSAPDAIVSPDGNVYVHWEFHSDLTSGCSTINARPFLLRFDAK